MSRYITVKEMTRLDRALLLGTVLSVITLCSSCFTAYGVVTGVLATAILVPAAGLLFDYVFRRRFIR